MQTANPQKIDMQLRSHSTKELANMYGVSKHVFRKWLQPFAKEIGQKQGHYFNIAQVKTIFDKLGAPGNYPD